MTMTMIWLRKRGTSLRGGVWVLGSVEEMEFGRGHRYFWIWKQKKYV